ncbi:MULTISPECIES: GntP family permease [unclassified Aeromicrobium]|uniref:GntP family permease n=1 Tax=unclassified Aeromicrobium TaxID=2633570 RepID=UPI00288ADE2A|nr:MULTISPECIES: GntP family permease [unclassified Aeromicrobium]
MADVLVLVGLVLGLVVLASVVRLHPFAALLITALVGGLVFGLPLLDEGEDLGLVGVITSGFGSTLGNIGLVIVLGTVIGVILDKSGAAITMADWIVKKIGQRFPTVTMSVIGYIVSIPVFCDSGYVILNSLKESMAARQRISPVAMSVALATGLFATHTLVPPTPGPIAAAGSLGLGNQLGLVILVGLPVALVAAVAGNLWSRRFRDVLPDGVPAEEVEARIAEFGRLREDLGTLPSPLASFAPIFVPLILIMLGSVAAYPTSPLGDGPVATALRFIGLPVVALLVGVVCALPLLPRSGFVEQLNARITLGITEAAPILLITGAGGAFGAVIQATPVGSYLGNQLSDLGIGILVPFLVAAALKTAQGSSTVALVTTSALMAPLVGDLGFDSDYGRVLVVMAIGAGAMVVSHANDSYFWVVSQFSRMSVKQAYAAQTAATGVMGVSAIAVVSVLSLFV